MRLVTFDTGASARPGVVDGDHVVPVDGLPGVTSVLDVLGRLGELRAALAHLRRSAVPLDEARLGPPLAPRAVMATGTNYRSHVEEMGVDAPPVPNAGFVKLPGSVCGHLAAIELPAGGFVDYEGEVAVVIGAPARDVPEDAAEHVIAGLCLANDVSSRDAPMAHLVLAKGAPGFCPLGPALVTLDEVRIDDVEFRVLVNGEERQHAHASDMVHPIRAIVSSFSRALPLSPGDVILTGSPGGVGIALEPPRPLRPGDTVEVISPQLGRLANTFIAAAASDDDIRAAAATTST